MPSSRGFSQPRAWTQVSCTAGRFFVLWATREAQLLNVLNMSEYWWFSCSRRQNKAQMRVDHWQWIGCWDVKYEDFLEDNNSPWPVILFLFCQRRFLSYLDQENNCRSPLVLTCSAERKLLLLVVKRKKRYGSGSKSGAAVQRTTSRAEARLEGKGGNTRLRDVGETRVTQSWGLRSVIPVIFLQAISESGSEEF